MPYHQANADCTNYGATQQGCDRLNVEARAAAQAKRRAWRKTMRCCFERGRAPLRMGIACCSEERRSPRCLQRIDGNGHEAEAKTVSK